MAESNSVLLCPLCCFARLFAVFALFRPYYPPIGGRRGERATTVAAQEAIFGFYLLFFPALICLVGVRSAFRIIHSTFGITLMANIFFWARSYFVISNSRRRREHAFAIRTVCLPDVHVCYCIVSPKVAHTTLLEIQKQLLDQHYCACSNALTGKSLEFTNLWRLPNSWAAPTAGYRRGTSIFIYVSRG